MDFFADLEGKVQVRIWTWKKDFHCWCFCPPLVMLSHLGTRQTEVSTIHNQPLLNKLCGKYTWTSLWQILTRVCHIGGLNIIVKKVLRLYKHTNSQPFLPCISETLNLTFFTKSKMCLTNMCLIYIYILSTIYQLANHKRGFAPRDHPIYPIFHFPKAVFDS